MSAADPHGAIAYGQASALVAGYAAKIAGAKPAEPDAPSEAGARSESVPLLEALGRVLAEPVLADRDQPPFARSSRDGFACRAAALEQNHNYCAQRSESGCGRSLRNGRVSDCSSGYTYCDSAIGTRALTVIGLLRAGQTWAGPELSADEAVEIMTGAPLPPGADCVVMVEHVERNGERIRLAAGRSIEPGGNVVPSGAEARCGATLVAAGTRVGAVQIAAAAAVGVARLQVYARPRVAILSTGDELVGLDAQPQTFQIRNSNSYSLAAQVAGLGGEPRIQPIAGDSTVALRAAIEAATGAGCELLLLSGGVSMGRYDLVEPVLASLGGRFFFTGVRMQPGKPVVFGELHEPPGVQDSPGGRRTPLPFFALPGNPVSTMVTFALLVAPVLAALGGERIYTLRFAEARLAEAVARKPGLTRFLPARLAADAGHLQEAVTVAPVPWQGSGDIAGTAQANCLVVVPELEAAVASKIEPGSETLAAGSGVRVLFL